MSHSLSQGITDVSRPAVSVLTAQGPSPSPLPNVPNPAVARRQGPPSHSRYGVAPGVRGSDREAERPPAPHQNGLMRKRTPGAWPFGPSSRHVAPPNERLLPTALGAAELLCGATGRATKLLLFRQIQ